MKTKICKECGIEKPLDDFYSDKRKMDGRTSKCRECTKKLKGSYGHRKDTFVCKIYHHQIETSKKRGHSPPTYTQLELKWWIFSQPLFHELYDEYTKSKFDRWKAPSVDRIDSNKGYDLDNIRLVTWKENLINFKEEVKNGEYQFTVNKNNQSRPVKQYDMDWNYIGRFESMAEAARAVGVRVKQIRIACRDENRSSRGYKWKWE